MSLLHPHLYLNTVAELTPRQLEAWRISGLILDVDNTLTTHDNPVPHPSVQAWLEEMRAAGIGMMILSNNHPPRVEPFAAILGLPFTADAAKPLTGGFKRAAATLGLGKEQIAVVGDQIFTDILGGNLAGMRTVLVKPIQPETTWFFRVKRRLEKSVLHGYLKKAQNK